MEERTGEGRWRFSRVIFYNSDGRISPVVTGFWGQRRAVVELIQESEALFSTNDPSTPGSVCARFIGWCYANLGEDFEIMVDNLPVPPWEFHGDDAGPHTGWLDRLLAEVSGWDPPAVLVQIDVQKITQGGQVLWQSEFGALLERMAVEGHDGPAYAEFLEMLRRPRE
jgi:hypothetical protein